MPQGKKPSIDWKAVRAKVEEGRKPIAQIARELGINPKQIYNRNARWKHSKTLETGQQGKPAPKPDHAGMVDRLYQAAEQQISHMESRLQTGEASFDEKEARMLGTIARTLDKLMELAKTSHKQETASDEQAMDADLDTIRTDLAKRLADLQRQ